MDHDEFVAELRRMAKQNGLPFLKENHLVQALSEDMAHFADFVNIMGSSSPNDKNKFLIVTSRSVTVAKTGMFSPKVLWSTRVPEIKSVRPVRGSFSGYIVDEVELETGSGDRKFQFGFSNPQSDMHKAEVAQGNAQVATQQIHAVMNSAAQAASAPSGGPGPNAAPGLDAGTQQLTRFIHSLAHLTGSDSIGQPFGEGLGLEGAMSSMSQYFPDAESVRRAGHMMAVTILAESANGAVGPDDLTYVMGTADAGTGALPPAQAEAAVSLAGAAQTFLGQFDQPGANTWELWKRRDDVAGELLCWHAVAWARLGTVGRVKAIS